MYNRFNFILRKYFIKNSFITDITLYELYLFAGKLLYAIYTFPLAVAEIIEYLEYIMPRRKIYFGMYTLKYAGKSGRIPSAAAFVGDRLNLKPIMKIYNKSLDTAAKVRGENKLMPKVVELAVADMEEGSPYELVVGNDETANKLVEDLMTEAVGYGPSGYYPIGAAVAANAGPKTVGIAFKVKADMEIPPYAHE